MGLNINIAKMESIVVRNKKFAKKWYKMLKNGNKNCPCVHNGYTGFGSGEFKYKGCPFDIRDSEINQSHYCFCCVFSNLLGHKSELRYPHLLYILKRILKEV